MQELPAIILAAGKGERLGNITEDIPKPLVKVNEVTILDNLISLLIRNGIEQIIVVTGYLHDNMVSHLSRYDKSADLVLIENEVYDTTNNIYSLWLARQFLSNGFYLFEADVFIEDQLIKAMLNSPFDNFMLLGKFTDKMNGTVVDLDPQLLVKNMYLKRHQTKEFNYSDKYKTINFYKIGADFTKSFFLNRLNDHINENDLNSYYELIIQESLLKDFKFHGLLAKDMKWWEIDTQDDLRYCENLFKNY